VDPASYALLAEFGRERFLRLTRGAAVLFPNLDEAVSSPGPGTEAVGP